MKFGKAKREPTTVVRDMQSRNLPPTNLDDFRVLESQTKQFYEERGPVVLPMDDVASGIQNIVEQFGKRPIPTDIPKVYQELIRQLHSGVQDMGRTFIETARAAEDLENVILTRCRDHEDYMQREMTIAKKVQEKYANIAAEIKAELDAEKGEGK